MLFYLKSNNSKMGDNSDKEKIQVTYFFMRNPYMKFQNISIHGSKVMLCTRKCDKGTNEHNERMDKPEAIWPLNFFKVGGIKTTENKRLNDIVK